MCPVPPTIEAGGSVHAISTGNKFGAVCHGDVRFLNFTDRELEAAAEALPWCPLVSVFSLHNSSTGNAKYRDYEYNTYYFTYI